MSYIKKHPILRKALVLCVLAVAGIGIGEIYQLFSAQTVEETLIHYQAKQLMLSTMRINGIHVIGKTWQLPAVVSPAVLKEAKGRALVVPQADKSHLVYTFDQAVLPDTTNTYYPSILPPIAGFETTFVIEMNNTQTLIMGEAPHPANEMQQHATSAFQNAGWAYQPTTLLWQKNNAHVQALFKTRDSGCSGILLLETQQ